MDMQVGFLSQNARVVGAYGQVRALRASEADPDEVEFELAISYLSASLDAMDMNDAVRGVLRQMLEMMGVMASRQAQAAVAKKMSPRGDTQSMQVAAPVQAQAAPSAWMVGDRKKPKLTKLDIDILHRVGRGLSNEAIAEELSLKRTSVATRLHRLFGKLGAERRYQAYRIARELGLLNVE